MSELICPKCGAPMRTDQRREVIEQRVECHGIFLDRGERERLTGAESAWYGEARHRDDDDDGDYRERQDRHEGRHRKRRGLLDDLLDFG